MRSFTDAELAKGITAIVAMPHAARYDMAYLIRLFVASAGVRPDTTDEDHPQWGRPDRVPV